MIGTLMEKIRATDLNDSLADADERLTRANARLAEINQRERETQRRIEDLRAEAKGARRRAAVARVLGQKGGAHRPAIEAALAEIAELQRQAEDAQAEVDEAEAAVAEIAESMVAPRIPEARKAREAERKELAKLGEAVRAAFIPYAEAHAERVREFKTLEAVLGRLRGPQAVAQRHAARSAARDEDEVTPEETLGHFAAWLLRMTLRPGSPALEAWEGTGLEPLGDGSLLHDARRFPDDDLYALREGRLPY